MKYSFIITTLVTAAISVSAKANDEVGVEGKYDVGHCSKANVMKDERLQDRIIEKLPFIGGKMHLGCCVSTVADACGQSVADMKAATEQLVNSEDFAVCMRAYGISKATNPSPPRLNECKSEACQNWAADCIDAGITPIRNAIKEQQK